MKTFTRFTYTTIDNYTTDPRPHESEAVARGYAVEMTNRMQGDLAVLGETGAKIATYRDGAEVQA